MDTNYWNPLIHIVIWGSILSWLVVPPILSNILGLYVVGAATYWGVANEVLASSQFWFYCILATAVAILPVILMRLLILQFKPTLLDDVRLWETTKRQKELLDKVKKQFTTPESSVTPRLRVPLHVAAWRSSYAFAHEEGFGNLIVTGRYLGASESDVEEERDRRANTWMRRPKAKKSSKFGSLVHASLPAATAVITSSLGKKALDTVEIAVNEEEVLIKGKDDDVDEERERKEDEQESQVEQKDL